MTQTPKYGMMEPILSVTTIAEVAVLTSSSWVHGKNLSILSTKNKLLLTILSQGDTWTCPSLTVIDLTDSKQPCVKETTIFEKHILNIPNIIRFTLSPDGSSGLAQDGANVAWLVGKDGVNGTRVKLNQGQPVCFSQWVAPKGIALISDRETIRVNTDNKVLLQRERINDVSKGQTITDYQRSPLFSWCFAALAQLNNIHHPKGFLDIHTVNYGQSAPIFIDGFAGAFLPSDGRDWEQEILVADVDWHEDCLIFKNITLTHEGFLPRGEDVFPINISNIRSTKLTNVNCTFTTENDIPIAVRVDHDADNISLAVVVTKKGYLHLFDYRLMCHLETKRILTGFTTVCAVGPLRKETRLTVVDSEGKVQEIEISLDNIVPVFVARNLPNEAVVYAELIGRPLRNNAFMSAFLGLVRHEAPDFCLILSFCLLNTDHLTKLQGQEVLTECFRGALRLPQFETRLMQLAFLLYERVGLEWVIALYGTGSNDKGLLMLLKEVPLPVMSLSILCKYITLAVQNGDMGSLMWHEEVDYGDRIPHAESVVDFLVSGNLPAQLIDPLLEKLCIRVKCLDRLVSFRMAKGFPVQLRFLLEQLELTDKRAQLLRIMTKVALPLLDRFTGDIMLQLERQLDLDLNLELLRSIYRNVVVEMIRQDKRTAAVRFMGYLAKKGIPDAYIYTCLITYYASKNRLSELKSLLRDNQFYSAAVVGKWCEVSSDPRITPLALFIYEERELDDDFLRVTNKFGYFRQQAGYLLKRHSEVLWQRVLDANSNPKRASLVKTDLISHTQLLIRKLLRKGYNNEQVRFLQRFSVQCLVNSQLPEGEIDKEYGEQLSTYDPLIVGAALAEGRLLELAKKMFVQGKCWRDAVHVQIQLSQNSKDFLTVKELACTSGDPGLLTEVGKICLDNGDLNYAIQCFLDAKCFLYHNEICLLAQKDDINCEWNLLIRFLESAQPPVKSSCITVTLALAYGRAHRLADLNKLVAGGTGSIGSPDANLCRICDDSPKRIVFVPCGHLATCEECSKKVDLCPICRSPVQQKIKTYDA
ncbi:uncharacterized protein LOC129592086 isoform X2 [Paramacrobiotus metropolitanus]|uniref:uncharacterized protein LOC129592086 isoform X2 n=1 Tax=Paramacrobiotus metropolitanus TaxID=2943436 RepID=UPI002445C6B7|nr:uncharacterized protein LOC129592086 isoform X2 [Paramacrobiotus metropolitanus]